MHGSCSKATPIKQRNGGCDAAPLRHVCGSAAAVVRLGPVGRKVRMAVVAASLTLPGLAGAQGTGGAIPAPSQSGPAGGPVYVPPAGCTLTMTVQERSCSVAQHFTCEADQPGDMNTVYFGSDGEMTYESRIDKETRWIWSRDPQTGIVDELEPGAEDDASFSTLVGTGRDDFDFWTKASDGVRLRQQGEDQLTGETEVIDGETLEKTRFKLTTYGESGETLIVRTGQQYISRSLGRFFGGIEDESDWTGTEDKLDRRPVEFIRPGEPGFASTQPRYDCEVLTASLGGVAP